MRSLLRYIQPFAGKLPHLLLRKIHQSPGVFIGIAKMTLGGVSIDTC